MSQMQQTGAHQMGQPVQQQAPVHIASGGRPMPQTSGPNGPPMGLPQTSVPQHVLPLRPGGQMPIPQVPPSVASQIGSQQPQNPLVMQQGMPPIQQHSSAPSMPPNANSLPIPTANGTAAPSSQPLQQQHHQGIPGQQQQQMPIPQVQSVQFQQPPPPNQSQVTSQPQTSKDSNETNGSTKPDTAELISFD